MTMEPTPVMSRPIRSPKGVEMVYANNLYCTYCPMVFASINGRKRHEMYHEGRMPYSCKECHASFYRPDRLSNHEYFCSIITSLGKNIKWCSFCDSFFRTDEGLRKHYKCHSMPYYPKERRAPKYISSTDPHPKERRAPKYISSTGPQRVFSCQLCPSSFQSAFFLGGHKYSVHGIRSHVKIASSNGNIDVSSGVGRSEEEVDIDDQMEQLREARETGIVARSEDKPFLGFPC